MSNAKNIIKNDLVQIVPGVINYIIIDKILHYK